MNKSTCTRCGKEILHFPSHPKKFCSRTCRLDPVPRFWQTVDKTATCWTWKGKRLVNFGYGIIKTEGKEIRAHRFSWELHNGPIPAGLSVLHHCDNPPCVNPAHLFLGTHKANSADMVAKGRFSRPAAKLSPSQAVEIRELYAAGGCSQYDLGKRFGVGRSAIEHVIHRSTWKNIGADSQGAI